jgi:hypothetical protein
MFGKKAARDILDKDTGHLAKLGKWVGSMNFTEQEKVLFWGKTMESVRDYSIKTMDESTERSRARRSIAMLWIRMQMALILCFVICVAFGDMERAEMMWRIATSHLMIAGTSAIIVFFFGAYAYGAHIKNTNK